MKILVANDDGINAEGINKLARALCAEHDVVVSAPDSQRSGASHSLTLHEPLRAVKTNMEGLDCLAYAVSGTPADCVKLAVSNLIEMPDAVISGINLGANLGTDVFYSGTVAAAMEGTVMQLPAIAVSICSHHPEHLDTAVHWALEAVKIMFPEGDPKKPICGLLNVNVPDIPLEEVRGYKFTTLCRRQYPDVYDTEDGDVYSIPKWGMLSYDPDENHDYNAIINGYVALTPLITDMCDYKLLKTLQSEK